jgi:hypothetical protein
LPVAAHLVEFKLLLFFQVAAGVSVFAVGLAALGQIVVLVFVQAVYLVIEIGFHVPATVLYFWVARKKYCGCGQKKGPDYNRTTDPMLLHISIS